MNHPTRSFKILTLFSLCLIIFIDAAGLGLILPLLNPVIMASDGILPAAATHLSRSIYYGVTLAIFSLCMFLSAPILGDLSDQVGRKKALILCLIGSTVAYLLGGISIEIGSMSLLIFSRVVAGLTAGSMPIAQAAMIDVSDPKEKASNLSFILFVIASGFVCGPLVGTALSNTVFVDWFRPSIPLFFMSLLSFVGVVFLYFFFQETFVVTQKLKVTWHKSVGLFIKAFQTKTIGRLSFIFFFMFLAWSTYYQYVSLLLHDKFHWDVSDIGVFMSVLAGFFAFAFLVLVRVINRYFNLIKSTFVFLVFLTIGSLFTALATQSSLVWAGSFLCAIGTGVSYTLMTTLFSNQVDESRQGWIMGVTTAVYSFACMATGIISAFLIEMSITMPFYMSVITGFIAACAMFIYHYKTKEENALL